MIKVFYVTKNNMPNYTQDFEWIQGSIYRHKLTGYLYNRRPLYNWGFGYEEGYEIYPSLGFHSLLNLAFQHTERLSHLPSYSITFDNMIGAIAVLIEDYSEQLMDYLPSYLRRHSVKVDGPDSTVDRYHENLKWFQMTGSKGVKLSHLLLDPRLEFDE